MGDGERLKAGDYRLKMKAEDQRGRKIVRLKIGDGGRGNGAGPRCWNLRDGYEIMHFYSSAINGAVAAHP